MRRSAAAVGLTVIGLWLILTFKSAPLSHARSSAGGLAPGTTIPAATGPPASDPGPAPSTTAAPAGAGPRTVDGAVFSNRYGDVQVAIVLNGTRITDVKALQMPFDRSRSAEISRQAAPLLHDEVVQAQSAQIDTVGGATYTSDSYARSLQSAIDKAHG